MYIPKTITVGYQKRTDTYTGQLAYIIYTDDKGVLRKETSWEHWRDKKISRDDFNNEPTSGFVLNRGVGGARMSYGWNTRNEYVRVYDPRNFEFEISVSNLLFILQECSSIKGKGLDGEFVYAWSGKELVLLPVDCQEYKECQKHSSRQAIKLDKKDIKPGYSYIMKDGAEVLYLGHFLYNNPGYYKEFHCSGKKHVFINLDKNKHTNYIAESGFSKIAECTSESELSQYPEEYEKFHKSDNAGYINKFEIVHAATVSTLTKDLCKKQLTVFIKNNENYLPIYIRQNYNHNYYWYQSSLPRYTYEYIKEDSDKEFLPIIKNGLLKIPSFSFRNNKQIYPTKIGDFYLIKITTIANKVFYI